MKRSGFVFGLASLVAACAAQPKHPLCDHDGSPACGNIGQVGRPESHPPVLHPVIGVSAEVVRIVPITVDRTGRPSGSAAGRARVETVARPRARTGRPLLAPPQAFATDQRAMTVQRARLDADGEAACGNCMSKGGRRSPE